jgi:hypothetical protein
MHLRQIPRAAVEKVFAHPVVRVEDMLAGNLVAVGEAQYGRKDRLLAVIYEETERDIRIITVHPIRASQYRMRLQRGRWKKK